MTDAVVAELRRETQGALDYHRAFTSELLIQLVGDLRGEFCSEVDEAAKVLNSDLREVRNLIAQISGRANGDAESLRAELGRTKAQVEELTAEVTALRADLEKANASLANVWARFNDEAKRRLSAIGA